MLGACFHRRVRFTSRLCCGYYITAFICCGSPCKWHSSYTWNDINYQRHFLCQTAFLRFIDEECNVHVTMTKTTPPTTITSVTIAPAKLSEEYPISESSGSGFSSIRKVFSFDISIHLVSLRTDDASMIIIIHNGWVRKPQEERAPDIGCDGTCAQKSGWKVAGNERRLCRCS